MLRVNTSLVLKLPPFKIDSANIRLRKSRDQMRIEQRLNTVGRGRLLASRQTTREQWADALHDLNSRNADDDSPTFRVSCLYSVLRSNPSVALSICFMHRTRERNEPSAIGGAQQIPRYFGTGSSTTPTPATRILNCFAKSLCGLSPPNHSTKAVTAYHRKMGNRLCVGCIVR
jgi:hypothetical protein